MFFLYKHLTSFKSFKYSSVYITIQSISRIFMDVWWFNHWMRVILKNYVFLLKTLVFSNRTGESHGNTSWRKQLQFINGGRPRLRMVITNEPTKKGQTILQHRDFTKQHSGFWDMLMCIIYIYIFTCDIYINMHMDTYSTCGNVHMLSSDYKV